MGSRDRQSPSRWALRPAPDGMIQTKIEGGEGLASTDNDGRPPYCPLAWLGRSSREVAKDDGGVVRDDRRAEQCEAPSGGLGLRAVDGINLLRNKGGGELTSSFASGNLPLRPIPCCPQTHNGDHRGGHHHTFLLSSLAAFCLSPHCRRFYSIGHGGRSGSAQLTVPILA